MHAAAFRTTRDNWPSPRRFGEQTLTQARATGGFGETAHAVGNPREAYFHMGRRGGCGQAATRWRWRDE
jgi:hypothetical protein